MSKAELRVFVASPGGLDDERLAVEEIANMLNSNLGDRLNVVVTVQRFEQLAARAGRPQGQINDWVDRCEVLIAILHRKLGSHSGEGTHTGFSEEFDRAISRFSDTGRPVVSLHFKTVDAAEEEDAGPKLREVINFRERIEREHVGLYRRFESLDGFKYLVLQLLTEEMHELLSRAKNSDDESAPQSAPQLETPVHGNTESNGTESGIAEVLQAFSDVIRGGESEYELDPDRLMMFATGAARKAEAPGVHLTNRIFLRREPQSVSRWESEAWFLAFVADHGRSTSVSERTVPFALSVGRNGVAELLQSRGARFLNSDVSQLQRGYLRLLSAFQLRPDLLWPSDGSSAPWEQVAEASPRFEIIEYWATVASGDDKAAAECLAGSENASTAKLGIALLSLLVSEEPLDPIVFIDPLLLLNRRVVERCGGFPAERVSTDVLLSLLKRTHLDDKVKELASNEIARRGAWTLDLIDEILGDGLIGRYLADSWKRRARDLLMQTTSAETSALIAEAIIERKGTDSRRLLAEFAGSNPLFRQQYLPTAPDYFAAGDLHEHFMLHGSDAASRKYARQALTGTFEPMKQLIERIRDNGADEDLIEFVERRAVISALTYLARTPHGLTKPQGDRLRAMVTSEKGFRADLLLALEEVADDSDIPVLLDHDSYQWHDDPERLGRLLGRATLARLRSLLDHDSTKIVTGALTELERRDRLPTQTKLRAMLRHSDADVRIQALRLLAPQLANAADFIAIYVGSGPNYFYNVVCELDRIASGSPDVFQ